ncbi:MAG: hypothetical protein OIF57_05710 [Marinobacterium sp.]|nr:hypothetical protein [Marinobacterium sp.]
MAITRNAADQQHNPYATLSFVQPAIDGVGYNFWHVPPTTSYGQACRFGYQFGADFAQYLLANPQWVGANLLGNIVRACAADMATPAHPDDSDKSHGYLVGFLSYLERLVYTGAQQIDPLQLANRLQGQSLQIELNRTIRAMNGTEPDDDWFFEDSEGQSAEAEQPAADADSISDSTSVA